MSTAPCGRSTRRPQGEDKADELGTPDIVLLLSEEVAVFDNLEGRLWLIVNVDPAGDDAWAQAMRRLDNLEHRLRSGSTGTLN